MNAFEILEYGHQLVLESVEGLQSDDWNTPGVCGIWSVREIIAHLASYELILVDVLESFLEDGPTPHLNLLLAQGDSFNDAQVAVRMHKSSAAVLQEYIEANQRAMALLAQVPAETLRQAGTLPWYGPQYSLDDFLVFGYHGHKREHCAQIAVFRDRPVAVAYGEY